MKTVLLTFCQRCVPKLGTQAFSIPLPRPRPRHRHTLLRHCGVHLFLCGPLAPGLQWLTPVFHCDFKRFDFLCAWSSFCPCVFPPVLLLHGFSWSHLTLVPESLSLLPSYSCVSETSPGMEYKLAYRWTPDSAPGWALLSW